MVWLACLLKSWIGNGFNIHRRGTLFCHGSVQAVAIFNDLHAGFLQFVDDGLPGGGAHILQSRYCLVSYHRQPERSDLNAVRYYIVVTGLKELTL